MAVNYQDIFKGCPKSRDKMKQYHKEHYEKLAKEAKKRRAEMQKQEEQRRKNFPRTKLGKLYKKYPAEVCQWATQCRTCKSKKLLIEESITTSEQNDNLLRCFTVSCEECNSERSLSITEYMLRKYLIFQNRLY